MSDQNQTYAELISRYLSGNATDAEVQQLEAWVLADPENKALFIAYKKAWFLTGIDQPARPEQVAEIWNQTAEQIFESPKVIKLKKKRSQRSWLPMAAAIAVLVVAAIWGLWVWSGDQSMRVSTADAIVSVRTPDGSRITLSHSSSLTYSETDEQRHVALVGEAFFDVARDSSLPFVIQAQELEVVVLGTSFYVAARPEATDVQVSVASGSVRVSGQTTSAIRPLEAGETVIYDRPSRSLSDPTTTLPDDRYVPSDSLTFRNATLEQVAFALSRRFVIDITLEITDTGNCLLEGDYTDIPLSEILQLLSDIWDIRIRQEGENKYVFIGDSCS